MGLLTMASYRLTYLPGSESSFSLYHSGLKFSYMHHRAQSKASAAGRVGSQRQVIVIDSVEHRCEDDSAVLFNAS